MKTLIKSMFGELSIWGKFWMYVGLACLAAAAGMSFKVGWHMTSLHAIFLACLSIVTAFAPETAYRMWEEGKKGAAIAIGLICIPLFPIEFFQHAAYTAGIRGNDIAITRVQNTKFDRAQHAATREESDLKMWKDRLATLTAENGWSATVTADALRAKLPGLNLAIEQEAKRGGCGPKCLVATKERDEIQARIAVLEERTSLQQKIDATKVVVERKEAAADTAEHRSSVVERMNGFLIKSVAIAQGQTKVSEFTQEATEQSANLALALAGTGLPAFAFFCAGLFRTKRKPDDQDRIALPANDVHPDITVARETVHPVMTMPRISTTTRSVADVRRAIAGLRA